MKLLIDENISWRVTKQILPLFPDSKHVNEVPELSKPSRDTEIWDYALNNQFIILTKDDDFYKLIFQKKNTPKLIFLKGGNLNTKEIVRILMEKHPELEKFNTQQEYLIFEVI